MPLVPPMCPECKAYEKHHPECENITFEDAKEQLKRYYGLYKENYAKTNLEANKRVQRADKYAERMKAEMQQWKAKFNEVKHENNQLRKKLKSNG